MKAVWNGKTIAESDNTILIEGNHYFPKESVHEEYLKNSDQKSTCPWKGEASYFDLQVTDQINEAAAWYYSKPKPTAIDIVGKDFSNHIAFWRGVEVTE